MVDLIGIFLVCFLYIIVSWLFFLFIHLFCFDVIFYSLNFHIDRFNKHFCLSYHLSTSLLLSLGFYLSCLSIYLVLLFFFLLVIKLFTLLPCSQYFFMFKVFSFSVLIFHLSLSIFYFSFLVILVTLHKEMFMSLSYFTSYKTPCLSSLQYFIKL